MDFIIFFFYCNSDWGLPDDSVGKESTCNAGDMDLIPVWGRSPGGGHGNPLQCSCPHGLRSLTGYSPKGCRVGQNWATKQAHTRNSDISQFCGIFDILNVLLPCIFITSNIILTSILYLVLSDHFYFFLYVSVFAWLLFCFTLMSFINLSFEPFLLWASPNLLSISELILSF